MSKGTPQNMVGVGTAHDVGPLVQRFNLGAARVDQALDQGLMRASLHEIFLSRPRDVTVAVGFKFALILRVSTHKSVYVAQQDFIDTGWHHPNRKCRYSCCVRGLHLVKARRQRAGWFDLRHHARLKPMRRDFLHSN